MLPRLRPRSSRWVILTNPSSAARGTARSILRNDDADHSAIVSSLGHAIPVSSSAYSMRQAMRLATPRVSPGIRKMPSCAFHFVPGSIGLGSISYSATSSSAARVNPSALVMRLYLGMGNTALASPRGLCYITHASSLSPLRVTSPGRANGFGAQYCSSLCCELLMPTGIKFPAHRPQLCRTLRKPGCVCLPALGAHAAPLVVGRLASQASTSCTVQHREFGPKYRP
jgi:hypothetical protein